MAGSRLLRAAVFRPAASFTLTLAALSAVPAYLLGREAEAALGRMSAGRAAVVGIHGDWGLVSLVVLLAVAGFYLLGRLRRASPTWLWCADLLVLAAAGVLAYTGYLGAEVVRGPDHLQGLLPW